MNDTPTPRTDEITKHLDEALNLDSAVDFVVFADKLQDLCRQLERELGECVGKYDGLVKILERKQDRIDVYEREIAECQRRLNEFEHPRDPIDQPKTPPTR